MIKDSDSEKTWYISMFAQFLLGDCVRVVGNPAAFARDVETITSRTIAEGESFLTKTLPALGKVINLALLETEPLHVTAFKKRRKGSAIPAFLQGLLTRIFEDDGRLKNAPCIQSIRLVRQICFWVYKMERNYSEQSLRQASQKLIATDHALPTSGEFTGRKDLALAKALISSVFRKVDLSDMRPAHGPGAVAGGESVTEKRQLRHRFINLERCFRPYPWFYTLRDLHQNMDVFLSAIRTEYGLSRVAFVPKDSRGPRVISLEPAEYMWCQQALKEVMYTHIEGHRLTKGHVNFTDQTVNRDLALLWSEYDTLDMSEASDRNSLALVEFLFEKTKIWPWIQAARTPGTVLPSGEVLWFKKFAPMGSAVCFPVQALVYWALAVQALYTEGVPLWKALRSVYVYGDDLIVPHGYFAAINALFESCALRFNEDKCCISGKFRESCGLDAFDGQDVTPIRLKRSERGQALTNYVPLVEHANALQRAGYWSAASELRTRIRETCPVKLPSSPNNLPILAFLEFEEKFLKQRTKRYVRQVRGFVPQATMARGQPAYERCYLLESLSQEGPVGVQDPRVGERMFARKYAVALRARWVVNYPASEESALAARIMQCAKTQRSAV